MFRFLLCLALLHCGRCESALEYSVHSSGCDWLPGVENGGVVEAKKGKTIDAINITISGDVANNGTTLLCRVHKSGIGWMKWVKSGEVAGKEDGLQLEALEIKLQGGPEDVLVRYQVKQRGPEQGWLPWAYNGAAAGKTGLGRPITALKINLVLLSNV